MAESLVVLAQAFRAALVSFQPELHSGEDCAAVVEELALVEKLSAVTRVEAALRVKESGAHQERGFADVSAWMARVTGSTAGSAKAALQTVEALESQPEVKAALDAGELSFAQARELVRTEAAVPGSTDDLLEVGRPVSSGRRNPRAGAPTRSGAVGNVTNRDPVCFEPGGFVVVGRGSTSPRPCRSAAISEVGWRCSRFPPRSTSLTDP